MLARDVYIGEEYAVKVSGKLTRVRIVAANPHGGWDGVNVATGRSVRLRTAGRLRSNQTVADRARLHYTDLAAEAALPPSRPVTMGDFTGVEAELDRLAAARRVFARPVPTPPDRRYETGADFDEPDVGGAYDGLGHVYSDADPGL